MADQPSPDFRNAIESLRENTRLECYPYAVLLWSRDDADRTRWRAELWHRPYVGWMLAATSWRSTKTWATRDGKRVFGPFIRQLVVK